MAVQRTHIYVTLLLTGRHHVLSPGDCTQLLLLLHGSGPSLNNTPTLKSVAVHQDHTRGIEGATGKLFQI